MSVISFVLSALLAIGGVGFSVYGILEEQFKPTAIGLVLILAGGVFATLHVGSRWAARRRDDNA